MQTQAANLMGSPPAKKLKHMNNIGLDEDNESEDEGILEPQLSKYEALNPFKDLYPNSDLVKAMKDFGSNIVPLSMVGMMMNYTGNHLLSYIFTQFKRKIFYPMHKVISIQLLANGEILTVTKRTDCMIKRNPSSGHTVFYDQETLVSFRSKAIVLSNGGY